ncbi:hypothetical protein F4604DRAFT_1957834 [Suillus subluteus]|nr:hypothetical protein F4604DRAFT_1957834 [Suillus subluteus]
MSIPPFGSTAYSIMDGGKSIYHTAETDETYCVLLDLLFSRNRDRDLHRYLQALDLRRRIIVFVSTISDEGVKNLAPFSAPGRLKDTIANLKNSQGFTGSIISEPFVENANATAIYVCVRGCV